MSANFFVELNVVGKLRRIFICVDKYCNKIWRRSAISKMALYKAIFYKFENEKIRNKKNISRKKKKSVTR